MNRNSNLAKAISDRTNIHARRIETWTIAGLGADPDSPIDEQIPHYVELAEISGPGRSRSADLTARRLAAHGYACSRLRSALSAVFDESSDEVFVSKDPSTQESEDEAFKEYDSIATDLARSVDTLPPALRLIIRRFRQNARSGAYFTDESGDQVFHSAIVSLLHLFNCGEVLNIEALALMFGVDPSKVDADAIALVEQLQIKIQNIEYVYRSANLESIVAMAKWIRDHLDVVTEFLGLARATDSMLDDLATQFAPVALSLIEPFMDAFDGFAGFLVEIGMHEALIPMRLPS